MKLLIKIAHERGRQQCVKKEFHATRSQPGILASSVRLDDFSDVFDDGLGLRLIGRTAICMRMDFLECGHASVSDAVDRKIIKPIGESQIFRTDR
jgi:hypothetical protein